MLGARRIKRKGLWCKAGVVEGVDVKCSLNTKLGLAYVLLYATPALTHQCWPHPHTYQTGGCTGLESPCGQTGDGQSSQYEDSTAGRAHTDTVVFGGGELWPKPPGLESQAELSIPLGTDSLLLEQPPTPHPVVLKLRFENPVCIL